MRKLCGLPNIEMLEDRRMLTATMVGTVLHIDGTTADDVITLAQTKGKTGTYNVNIGGTATTFPKSLVSGILIHGNAGNDKITLKGLALHTWALSIYGDDGNDTITGSEGRDQIYGGAGNDVIRGMGGNDMIVGDAGNDRIMGDDGNDYIFGKDDNDTLYGDAGNDTVSGGNGDDILAGDDEDTLALVGHHAPKDVGGNDVLSGGDGNDWLLGGVKNAKIKDKTGQDTLTGGAGADVIDARGTSVITDKNVAEGDFTPAEDYTPANTQTSGIHVKIKLIIKIKTTVAVTIKKKLTYRTQYETVAVPAFIGVFSDASPADIQSKAADSIVYFDAPAGSTWKLRDVFRMWGVSFDATHIGRYFASTGHALTMSIRGVSNTDFANADLPVTRATPTEVVIKLS